MEATSSQKISGCKCIPESTLKNQQQGGQNMEKTRDASTFIKQTSKKLPRRIWKIRGIDIYERTWKIGSAICKWKSPERFCPHPPPLSNQIEKKNLMK
jgi:hypothetical protein